VKETFTIRTVDGLRQIATPLRMAIVTELTAAALGARELAAKLGVTPPALYYHLRQLQRVGLVVIEKRPGSRQYRAVAARIRVLPSVLQRADGALAASLRGVLETTGAAVDAAAATGALQRGARDVIHAFNRIAIPKRRVAAFRTQLRALIDRFEALADDDGEVTAVLGVVFLALEAT
jgi:DNA-binding transcriptional ArsR family regulator